MEKMIFQWVHHILSIEACDAIRRELNCFISMINSVATLCGFAPLASSLSQSSLCEPAFKYLKPVAHWTLKWLKIFYKKVQNRYQSRYVLFFEGGGGSMENVSYVS